MKARDGKIKEKDEVEIIIMKKKKRYNKNGMNLRTI